MELEDGAVAEIFVAISEIIKTTLFENVSTKEGIVKLLPGIVELFLLFCGFSFPNALYRKSHCL